MCSQLVQLIYVVCLKKVFPSYFVGFAWMQTVWVFFCEYSHFCITCVHWSLRHWSSLVLYFRPQMVVYFIFGTLPRGHTMLSQYMLSSCALLSIKTANLRIMQITPHDSPVTLIFCCQRSWRNSNRGAKCRWGRLQEAQLKQGLADRTAP